jgi:translation initiation factor 2 beta subunit (eIF-2beta)/eIF-5
MLEAYKKACEKNNTTPTTEIKRFIAEYCKEHGTDMPEE